LSSDQNRVSWEYLLYVQGILLPNFMGLENNHDTDPVMNQAGFHGMSENIGFVSVAHY